MTETQAKFEHGKANVMRFSEVLSKAKTPQELRALMLADTQAFYHSYDMLQLISFVEGVGCLISECMGDGLDEEGAPDGN